MAISSRAYPAWPCIARRPIHNLVVVCITLLVSDGERFDLDRLRDDWPFEIDRQVAHLFKHPYLGVDDISEVWASDPLFYPAVPPAHWLMVAEVNGQVLMVPLAPSARDRSLCRPIGCYVASARLARTYREDR